MKRTLISAMLTLPIIASGQTLRLYSPSGNNTVTFSKDGKDLTYSVNRNDTPVILPSRAGLNVDNRVWEMALGKRDLKQTDSWMDLLEVDSITYHIGL